MNKNESHYFGGSKFATKALIWVVAGMVLLGIAAFAQQYVASGSITPTAATPIGGTPTAGAAPSGGFNMAKVDSNGNQYYVPGSTPAGSGITPYTSTVYETSAVVKASAGVLYGFTVYNSAAAAQFYMVFNSTTVPANGTPSNTTPLRCPATTTCSYSITGGILPINMTTGISISNSSTSPTKTIGAADSFFQVFFQ